MTTTNTSPAAKTDDQMIEQLAQLRATTKAAKPQAPQPSRARRASNRSQVKLCTKCGELYPSTSPTCPGCEPAKDATRSEPGPKTPQSERRTNGSQPSTDRMPSAKVKPKAGPEKGPKATLGARAKAKARLDLKRSADVKRDKPKSSLSSVVSDVSAYVRSHRLIFGAFVVALVAAAAFFFLVMRDPDAVVASSAIDAARPKTSALIESASTADTLAELAAVGAEAATAESTSADGIEKVAALGNVEYRSAASSDLHAQQQLLAGYAAMEKLNSRTSSSKSIASVRKLVVSQSAAAAPAIVSSSKRVAAIGALKPKANRVELGASQIQAANRHTLAVLLTAEQKVGSWERRLAAWHLSQKAKRQELSSYVAETNSTMDEYTALRTELDRLSTDELDQMTLVEAQAALQDHHDRRAELRDRLLSETPPSSASADLRANHDQLVTSLEDGMSGLDAAITALDESNNVAFNPDQRSPDLFGDSFRDSTAWGNYESTSDRNTEKLASVKPAWQGSADRAKSNIDRARAPRRPRV